MTDMVITVLILCLFSLHTIEAQDPTIKQIRLNIDLKEKRPICTASDTHLAMVEGNTLNLTIVGKYDFLNEATCSSERFKSVFLEKKDFVESPHSKPRIQYATLYNTTKTHHGRWNCTFLSFKDQNISNNIYHLKGHFYTKISCSFEINVTEFVPEKQGQKTLYYIIGGVVALVIIIMIIIAQTVIIFHFKAKAKLNAASLPHLHRPSIQRDDSTRYSTMPGERKRSQKREASGIYQSLENLRAAAGIKPPTPTTIRDRPPMPLPLDDDEHIYEDGQTLQRMFTPTPPPVDTLPRKPEKKKAKADTPKTGPKPGKIGHVPVTATLPPMEDYDYPDVDTVELLKSQGHQKSNPVSTPPKPVTAKSGKQPKKIQTAPVTGGVLMNELKDNLLRKRMNSNAPKDLPSTRQSPGPPVEMNTIRNKPPPTGRPQEINHQETHPRIHPLKQKPQINPQKPKPQEKPKPLGAKGVQFQHEPSPQEIPNVRRPNVPTQEWAQKKVAPHNPEETVPLKTWNQKPMGMRPQVLADTARSPPVSRVQPMVQKPAPAPIKPKPAVNPMKPAPPEPQAAFNPVKKLPPEPIPQEGELYEAVAEGYSSSDEEWQYEPLPNYNIYSM